MKIRDVSVLILYHHDKILLQKRNKFAKRFPNSWGLFGGGVEKNETPRMALKREIKEELGLKLITPKFLRKYPYVLKEKGERGHVWVYIEKYSGNKLCLNEGEEMRWVHLSKIMDMDLHPIYRDIINDIRQSDISMVL